MKQWQLGFEHGVQLDDVPPGNGDLFNGLLCPSAEQDIADPVDFNADAPYNLKGSAHQPVKDSIEQGIAGAYFELFVFFILLLSLGEHIGYHKMGLPYSDHIIFSPENLYLIGNKKFIRLIKIRKMKDHEIILPGSLREESSVHQHWAFTF